MGIDRERRKGEGGLREGQPSPDPATPHCIVRRCYPTSTPTSWVSSPLPHLHLLKPTPTGSGVSQEEALPGHREPTTPSSTHWSLLSCLHRADSLQPIPGPGLHPVPPSTLPAPLQSPWPLLQTLLPVELGHHHCTFSCKAESWVSPAAHRVTLQFYLLFVVPKQKELS